MTDPKTAPHPTLTLAPLARAEDALREARRALAAAQASIATTAASMTLEIWDVSQTEATKGASLVGLRTDSAMRATARIEALRAALSAPAALADPAYRASVEARLARAIDAAPKRAVQDCSAMVLGAAIAHWIPPSD